MADSTHYWNYNRRIKALESVVKASNVKEAPRDVWVTPARVVVCKVLATSRKNRLEATTYLVVQ